jgi:hypothetical protein
MLRPSAPDLRVYLHRAPIEIRAGRNGLAAIAREVMQKDPFDKTCMPPYKKIKADGSDQPFRAILIMTR